jgi:hypothetical protein
MKLVTIKEARYAADLAVLRSRLEDEGIMCRLKNELNAQVISYIPSIYVELQVAEKDLERALEIMKETEQE